MIDLIRKDISVNTKFILLSFLLSVVAVIVLELSNFGYASMEFYICLSGCFTYIVGRSCYIDEKGSSKMWIRTLPIKSKSIVDAKYILMIISIIEGVIIFYGIKYIMSGFSIRSFSDNVYMDLIILALHLIYCGLFLHLFYKYNYSVAQYAIYFMILILIFSKMVDNKKYIDLSIFSFDKVSLALIVFGAIVLIISWIFTRNIKE